MGALVALALTAGGAPRRLAAQDTGSGEPPGLVAMAGLRATSLAGHGSTLPGGGLALRLGPHLELGGAGWILPDHVRLPDAEIDLSFGYGGLSLRLLPEPAARAFWGARLLLGAGNAAIESPAVGVELDADNVFVAEPELEAGIRVFERLTLSGTAGWRVVAGVDRSLGLTPSDLGGWSAALSLVLGLF